MEMRRVIGAFKPQAVVIDPVSNLTSVGNQFDITSMLTRLVDHLKVEKITSVFTSLISDVSESAAGVGVSSLMDTWITLQDIVTNGEKRRGISIIKSRGMGHSSQVREFKLTNKGIVITEL